MRYCRLLLLSLCATSLSAMDPSKDPEALSASRSLQHLSLSSSPSTSESLSQNLTTSPISEMVTWSENTALIFRFHRTDNEGASVGTLCFNISPDNTWSGAQKTIHGYFGNYMFFSKYQPQNFKTTTVDNLIHDIPQCLENFKNEAGQPIPGQSWHCTVELRLFNLSNRLPVSAYVPHVDTISVTGSHFSRIDHFCFPDLRSATFQDITHGLFWDEALCDHREGFYYNTRYMAPPSSCILSSKIFQENLGQPSSDSDPAFELTTSKSYAFPETFTPHIESGRLKITGDSILKKAPTSTGDIGWLAKPLSQRPSYSDKERVEKFAKQNFLFTKEGIWTYNAQEKQSLHIPPEMWAHILSFLQDPFDLAKLAFQCPELSYLNHLALERLKTPLVITHISPMDAQLSLNASEHSESAPSSAQPSSDASSHTSTAQKTFVLGLPKQIPENFLHAKNRSFLNKNQFGQIEETVTSTSQYSDTSQFLGIQSTVSWSTLNSNPETVVVGNFFCAADDLKGNQDRPMELNQIMSAIAFDQFFNQKVPNAIHEITDATPGPAEDPSIQEPSQTDSKDNNPKARAPGSDDNEA